MDYGPYFAAAQAHTASDPAHDMLHVQRVFENAQRILCTERANEVVVLTAILLHELFNYPKGHPDSHQSGDVCAAHADQVLRAHAFPEEWREHVLDCIRNHSFSKGVVPSTLEGKVVQDADRLDSIGAVGIARCFATCAEMGRPFYNLTDPFCHNRQANDKEFGIDHFYLKLLKIEERLHTATARSLARERSQFMRQYLQQLEGELAGTR